MLVTAKELSKELRLHKAQIYTLAKEGKIPFYRIDRAIRFDADEVLSHVRHTQDASSDK